MEFAVKMQEAGADAVCIHGRTKAQMYTGKANWKIVSELRGEIDIPYFINGDINSVESGVQALEESKADGISIGRGLIGNPWLLGEIDKYFKTGEKPSEKTIKEKIKVLKEHLDAEIAFRGELNGIKFFRKFYSYYIKGIRRAGEYRGSLVREENYEKIIKILDEIEQNE